MKSNLWLQNTPNKFWLCSPPIQDHFWQNAIQKGAPTLGFATGSQTIDELLSLTLGEGRFGTNQWNLSTAKRIYYALKPALPKSLTRFLRRYYNPANFDQDLTCWPIDQRYVEFQWEVLKQVLTLTGGSTIKFRHLWPGAKRFSFVLTHDIETKDGQAFVRDIADLEEELGFRSSFNFVPERYPVDKALMVELRGRGFEIGVHGLKHDGKLFSSESKFMQRAERINHYLSEFNAFGFRSPLMHRHPEWLQALNIEYDLSFFDSDPYEPIPGGTMSIWPFVLGRFIELPYTLVQDSTLFYVLRESTPQIWLEKLEFIKQYYGMALVNTHPDYLKEQALFKIYHDFLKAVKDMGEYWHALPREAACWWRERSESPILGSQKDSSLGTAVLENDQVVFQ